MKVKVFKNKSVCVSQCLDTWVQDFIHHSVKQGAELSEDKKAISIPNKGMAFYCYCFLVIFFFDIYLQFGIEIFQNHNLI